MIPLNQQMSRGGWLFSADGAVYTLGDAPFYGSFELQGHERIVEVGQSSPSNYRGITNENRIISCGNIRESKRIPLADPDVHIVASQMNGGSYGYLQSNGFGYLRNLGSDEIMLEFNCSSPINVKRIALTYTGLGVYVLFVDGQVKAFGDAVHVGDFLADNISARPCDLSVRRWGKGYWIIDEMGGVFCFGDADYFGSVPGDKHRIHASRVVGHFSGRGYWIVDSNGMLLPFGYANVYERETRESYQDIIGFIPHMYTPEKVSLGAKKHGVSIA